MAGAVPKTTTPGPWSPTPAPARRWFAAADWCDPSHHEVLFRACEKYLGAPIWWSVVVADVVGLWFIAAILLRQREQDKERLQRRRALPKAVRLRRDWSAVAAAVRLASLGAGRQERPFGGGWAASWDLVAKARQERKEHQDKKDYNLSAVMTRASGPLIVTVVCLLIAWETHAFYALVLPWLDLGEEVTRVVGYLMAVFPIRIYYDYARTTLTDPGRPEAEESSACGAVNWVTPVDAEVGGASVKREPSRCLKCGSPKPARSHHCKVCRRCVLKMDHHCPVVNNCVGLRNHRYFCLFLVDLVIATFLLAGLMAPQAGEAVFSWKKQLPFARRVHVLSSFCLAMLVQGTVGPFFIFHLQLILMNETTLEYIARRSRKKGKTAASPENDYSRGVLENFAETCGAPPVFCRRRLSAVFERLVPAHVARLAKRSV